MVKGKNVKFLSNSNSAQKVSVIGGFSELNGKVQVLVTYESIDQDVMINWVKTVKLVPS